MSGEEAIRRLSRSPHGVWTAIDPQSTLLLAITVGPRTQAMAQRVVHQVMEVLAPGCIPLWVTDGLKEYLSAARPQARCPRRAGCLCPNCSMRRSSKRRGAGA